MDKSWVTIDEVAAGGVKFLHFCVKMLSTFLHFSAKVTKSKTF